MKILNDKPIIHYPCNWSYRIIGRDEQLLRSTAKSVADGKTYSIKPSNKSSGGKYVSLSFTVHVDGEQERLSIFTQLKKSKAVKYVL
ncbi:MAG: DUF493 domain-containing protein [candidate division KSB1 bacterium]|nr:DUF493 domain-containing protein [candidate division KSB1 bacterium]